MHKNYLVLGLLVLSFLGIADSWYLASKALFGGQLVCNIKGLDGCNQVAQSVYSHLFGIPLGLYGVVFYSLLFIFTALITTVSIKYAHDILAGLGIIGLIASLFFVGIQVFLIKAVCIYCLASGIISLGACVITVVLWKRYGTKISKKPSVVTIPGL